MFPFASHLEYGYKLAPFASETLAEAGGVAAELGHRLSTHPGQVCNHCFLSCLHDVMTTEFQFTQLGSPRKEVIESAIRDLEYHDELLSLLKLPPQEDRDAVMILHMGGTFGDKKSTLDRFRGNYKDLSPSVKMRLVLENDDVSWSVHDLLPVCEELNIPLCLDFHHNNIMFDSTQLQEGTHDIMNLFPRIKATWVRKEIRQKMHYSEPCPEAITGMQRRKHNPRPITLPPCSNDMDLMIEAKDKEQAVFELMRTFKLPGWDAFNNIIPYERSDDNRPLPRKAKKKKTKKQIAAEIEEFGKELSEEEESAKEQIPKEHIAMGGQDNRVYWPPGMEEWLRPKKREIKKNGGEDEEDIFKNPAPANFAARKAITTGNRTPLSDAVKEKLKDVSSVADIQKLLDEVKAEAGGGEPSREVDGKSAAKKLRSTPSKKVMLTKKKTAKSVPTPSISNLEGEEEDDLSMPDLSADDGQTAKAISKAAVPARQSIRAIRKRKSYAEDNSDFSETE